MGYRFNGNRNYALQLTKAHPTKKFELTGAPHMIPLQGIRKDAMERILHYSENAQHAAQQIEALSLGQIMEPEVGPAHAPTQQFDEAVIERIVQQRTENVIAQQKDVHLEQMAEMRATIAEMQKKLAEQAKPVTRKKRGRKPGKKSVVEQAKKDLADEPELTEAEEEAVANLKTSIDE